MVLESPHRLLETLEDAAAVLGDREAAVGRELTKLHEEILRGPLAAVRAQLAAREQVRGEVVLVIAGAAPAEAGEESESDQSDQSEQSDPSD